MIFSSRRSIVTSLLQPLNIYVPCWPASGMTKPGKLWVGSIVIDCRKFDEMIAFWRAALSYELRYPPSDDWAILYDPTGSGPNISFQKDPVGPGEIYWFHFDLYSSDPEGEVKRLMQLGAKMMQPMADGKDYVTLSDPDGNPFDIIDTKGFKFGQRVNLDISG